MTELKKIRSIEFKTLDDGSAVELIENGKVIYSLPRGTNSPAQWESMKRRVDQIREELEATPLNACAPGLIAVGQETMEWRANPMATLQVACSKIGLGIWSQVLRPYDYKKELDTPAKRFIPKPDGVDTTNLDWCLPSDGRSQTKRTSQKGEFTITCTSGGTQLDYKPISLNPIRKVPSP
ncbi:MAG: hypothetical protein ACLPPF_21305 [Rhodomicrobium sp.]